MVDIPAQSMTRAGPPGDSPGRRELIVVAATGADLRARASGFASASGADVAPLERLLGAEGVRLTALFGSEDRLLAEAGRGDTPTPGAPPADASEVVAEMARFYAVEAPDDRLDQLAGRMRALDLVETAYVKPAAALATLTAEDRAMSHEGINDMLPSPADAPPATPDFTNRQGYLDSAPGGIDARWAWTQSGGRGGGVRVVDCEWGWRFTHEDLRLNQGGVIAGTADPSPTSNSTNHGTAVLGEISGDVNALGITGIAPDAVISASAFSVPSATAIRAAADRLGPGDVLLLEIHRPGPNANGSGQFGFIAVEWWPDDYLAIRYAVDKGVVVVEAAGNGFQDLNAAVYDRPATGFPSWWRNPFRRDPLDSGAVLVGAGAPPPGTHGRDHGPDRSRLDYSNHGACVDAQGWGREVTTTGYGNLQGGSDVDLWYTDTFSGTSSASPIVVGALASVQGVLRAGRRTPLSPARARELLRSTGSPQQDAPGRPATQRIGNRPNLRQLIPAALATSSWTGVQFRGSLAAGQTRRWFTYGWPAHWHVVWTVMPTTVRPGAPQVRWRVRTERASDARATYWIDVTNLSNAPVDFEARFAVLGW